MIKWEYYRKFKERFQTLPILKDLEFRKAYTIYFVLKIIQVIVIYGLASSFREKKYFSIIATILLAINWILEVRESKASLLTTMKMNQMKEFYMTNCKISKEYFTRGMVLTEVLWNISEGIGISFSILLCLIMKATNNIYELSFMTCLSIMLLYSIEFIVLFFEHKKNKYIELVFKIVLMVLFTGLGGFLSSWVLECPLSIKTNLVEAMQKWIVGIHSIEFAFDIEFFLRISLLLILLILYYIWIIKKEYKDLIYTEIELKVRDFGFFPIIFISLFTGVLMNRVIGKEGITYLINVLMISYTISFLLDDIFYFHDELSIDNDEERIYYWKENLTKLLEYKKRIYIFFYMKRIVVFYFIFYVVTIHKIADICKMIFAIIVIILICIIGFYEKNLAVINSPIHITWDYGTTKYNRNRIVENNAIGVKLLFIGIVVSIPAILYACSEVKIIEFYMLQIFAILGLVIYELIIKRNLKIKIQDKYWIIQLFDEEDNI